MVPLVVTMKKRGVIWDIAIAASARIQSEKIDGQIMAVGTSTKGIACRPTSTFHGDVTAVWLKRDVVA